MATKIYTLERDDLNRRSAWYAKMGHKNLANPNACYCCEQTIEIGDKVVTKIGRSLSHIYHYKCAQFKHVV